MTEPDTAQIAELVGAMAAAYPTVQMGDESIIAYVRMLQDIPVDVLATAMEQCTATSKWLPTPADIRAKVDDLTQPPAIPALEAWGRVVKQMVDVGYNGRPDFGDAIIKQAVDCLGWRTLCNSENQVADRAHFSQIYDQLVKRAAEDRRLLPAARTMRQIVQAAAQRQMTAGKPGSNVVAIRKKEPEQP